MTRHITAFLVKLAATTASLYFVALFFPLWGDMNLLEAIILGVLIAAIGYASDLFVPRAMNNIVAIALDFAVVTAVIYLANWFLPGYYASWYFSLFCGMLVAGVEIFYHTQFVRKTNEPVTQPDRKR